MPPDIVMPQFDTSWIMLNLKQLIVIFGSATLIVGLFLMAIVRASRRRSAAPLPPSALKITEIRPSVAANRPDAEGQVTLPRQLVFNSVHVGEWSDETPTVRMKVEDRLDVLRESFDTEIDRTAHIIRRTHAVADKWRARAELPDTTERMRQKGLEADASLMVAENAFSAAQGIVDWKVIGELFQVAQQLYYDAMLLGLADFDVDQDLLDTYADNPPQA